MQPPQKYARDVANGVADHRPFGQFQRQRGLNQFLRNLQQRDGQRCERLVTREREEKPLPLPLPRTC